MISDVTADVSEVSVPPVERLPMPVKIGDRDFLYGTPDSLTCEEFYQCLRQGQFATTAQIAPSAYIEAFEPIGRLRGRRPRACPSTRWPSGWKSIA